MSRNKNSLFIKKNLVSAAEDQFVSVVLLTADLEDARGERKTSACIL